MHRWATNSKVYLADRRFRRSVVVATIFLFLSLTVNFYAGQYALERASNPVTDIFLSNVPVFDVDGIFTYGAIGLWVFIIGLGLYDLKKVPFTLKSIALFIIIRALFISLTHIGPFPTHVNLDYSRILSKFTFGSDLFFSGHTGLPFLMALVFWDNKWLRYIFIAASIIFGIVVLLAHLHYSIDVASAFFITFTIYHLAEKFFKKDHEIFKRGIVPNI